MLSYIGKRILSLIPVLFVVSCVVFLVVYLIPGGPATALLGMEATPEQIEALNTELGFNRPFFVQYADWFAGIFRGDWGESYFLHQSVLDAIAEYFKPTLSLAILAQLIALALSVPLGIIAAYRRGTVLTWRRCLSLSWELRCRDFCLVCSLCCSLAFITSGFRLPGMQVLRRGLASI